MSWLTGWKYRKSVLLDRASGAVTNYQMWLTIYRSTGVDAPGKVYIGTNCEADYDDIRFTASDGTTLQDYWIESSDANSAIVVIEFNSIGTSATTFYMYYGKADAPSVSNGADTFIKFEDFEWGNDEDDLTTSGGSITWTAVTGNAKVDTAKSYGGSKSARFTATATYSSYTIPITADANQSIQLRFWKSENCINGPNLTQGNGTERWVVQFDQTQSLYYFGEGVTNSGVDCTAATWQLLEVNNFNFIPEGSFSIHLNSVNVANPAGMYDSATWVNVMRVLNADPTAGRDIWIDNVIVRNWRSVEPAWGVWGGEEEIVEGITITADPIETNLSIPLSTCLNIGSVVDGLITCSLSIPASTYLSIGFVVDGLINYSISIVTIIVIPPAAIRPPSTWITESKDQLPWAVDQDSINWLADKGEGVWDFEEARRVFGYNNNPRFVKVPTSLHQPCGHWHKVPSHYERNVVYTGSPLPDRRWMSVSMSSSGEYISLGHYNDTVAYYGGLYTSQDYGLTFTCQLEGVSRVRYVSVSPSGKYQYASVEYTNNDYAILYSSDYGISWDLSTVEGTRFYTKVSFSADDSIQCLHDYYGTLVYISTDYGNSWLTHTVGLNCQIFEISSDGTLMFYRTSSRQYWKSSNYGVSWIEVTKPYAGTTFTDKCFIKGTNVIYYFLAKDYYAIVYISVNGGITWPWSYEVHSSKYLPLPLCNVSNNGSKIVFIPEYTSGTPYVFYSLDSGSSWNSVAIVSGRGSIDNLSSNLAMSSDGKYLVYNNGDYTMVSSDYGVSWSDGLYYAPANYSEGYCRSAMSVNGEYQISILPYSTIKSFVFFSGDYGRLWTNYPRRIVEINNQLVIDEIVEEIVNEPVVWRTS